MSCRVSEEGLLSFIAKSRGLPWSFEWGICFPLACIHSLEIYAAVCFPIATFQEVEEFRHDSMGYLAICLAFALLALLLSEYLISRGSSLCDY